MLFNFYEFILAFVPIALIGFYLIGRTGRHTAALAWLLGASLFFYAWWNPSLLGLLAGSVLFNYSVGFFLAENGRPQRFRRGALISTIAVNLTLLGYFKYADFFRETIATIFDAPFEHSGIILPLAISFFTFQQVAYLVDTYRGVGGERSLLRYGIFVAFFPQLIAGPIVHHREMLPQFSKASIYRS